MAARAVNTEPNAAYTLQLVGVGDVEVEVSRSAEEVEEPFFADMLRTEGAALRHTAGVTREPAPNLVGLPCAPGSALW